MPDMTPEPSTSREPRQPASAEFRAQRAESRKTNSYLTFINKLRQLGTLLEDDVEPAAAGS